MRPKPGSYPSYFENYIYYVTQTNLQLALEQTWLDITRTFSGLSEDLAEHSYEKGKWTIKQMLIHMIDTERVFAYRALRFARKDPQQVLSFEENLYAASAEVSNRTIKDLLEEFEMVRKSTICLFRSFSDDTLLNSGKTAAGEVTVLALGYTICGHALHHINVFKELYQKSV
jgi:uncharacterized damage-inducible protein DinB